MRTSDGLLFTIIKRAMVSIFAGIMGLLLCFSDTSFAASAKDKKKQTAPSSTQSPSDTAPLPPATPIDKMKLDMKQVRPMVIIDYFKKKVDVPPGTMMATLPGGSPPDSATVQAGEIITLQWGIKGCNLEQVTAKINDQSVPLAQSHTTSDGCTYYKGEMPFSPQNTTTYHLSAYGSPTALTARKDFTVNVPRPVLDILTPEVNDETLNITLSVRNVGDEDLTATPLQVSYYVDPVVAGAPRIKSGSFRTSPLDIRKRGSSVQLGSFDLMAERYQVYTYKTFKINVTVEGGRAERITEEFQHECRSADCINRINDIALELVTSPPIFYPVDLISHTYTMRMRIKVKNISTDPAATPVRNVTCSWGLKMFSASGTYRGPGGSGEFIIEEIPVDRWLERTVDVTVHREETAQSCELRLDLDPRRTIVETNRFNNGPTVTFEIW
jgi:hypothetical protein